MRSSLSFALICPSANLSQIPRQSVVDRSHFLFVLVENIEWPPRHLRRNGKYAAQRSVVSGNPRSQPFDGWAVRCSLRLSPSGRPGELSGHYQQHDDTENKTCPPTGFVLSFLVF